MIFKPWSRFHPTHKSVLVYNLWVKLNSFEDRVIVDVLEQSVMMSLLIFWFIPDIVEEWKP
ncbi:MAG: hypothetical protein QXY52_04205 [Conexivisphaerales archaeon]